MKKSSSGIKTLLVYLTHQVSYRWGRAAALCPQSSVAGRFLRELKGLIIVDWKWTTLAAKEIKQWELHMVCLSGHMVLFSDSLFDNGWRYLVGNHWKGFISYLNKCSLAYCLGVMQQKWHWVIRNEKNKITRSDWFLVAISYRLSSSTKQTEANTWEQQTVAVWMLHYICNGATCLLIWWKPGGCVKLQT